MTDQRPLLGDAGGSSGSAMTTELSEVRSSLVVTGRRSVAADTVALTLASAAGADLPAWTPGAHIDLLLDGGTLVRQYSLCGSPADRATYRIAVLRDPNSRGGSEQVHASLQPGSVVEVRGPRNHFPLLEAPRYLFVAGGIGITPILPMIAAVAARDRDWRLHYGGRRRDTLAFLDELDRYGDRVDVVPEDERGLLDLASILGRPESDAMVYCCGPERLLGAVEAACAPWPAGSLHLERFAAKPQAAAADAVASFDVVCQRSGLTVQVRPDQTIIDAVSEAGVSVLSSCLEGVCGTCETAVIEGTPDHRDSLLSEEEREANDYMMICVSRSRTPRLVLDL